MSFLGKSSQKTLVIVIIIVAVVISIYAAFNQREKENWNSPVLPSILQAQPTTSGRIKAVIGMVTEEPVFSFDNRDKILYYSTFHQRFFVLENGTIIHEWVGCLLNNTDKILPSKFYEFKIDGHYPIGEEPEMRVLKGELPSGFYFDDFYYECSGWREIR